MYLCMWHSSYMFYIHIIYVASMFTNIFEEKTTWQDSVLHSKDFPEDVWHSIQISSNKNLVFVTSLLSELYIWHPCFTDISVINMYVTSINTYLTGTITFIKYVWLTDIQKFFFEWETNPKSCSKSNKIMTFQSYQMT